MSKPKLNFTPRPLLLIAVSIAVTAPVALSQSARIPPCIPEPAPASAIPSLKLESTKAPIDVIVIDHIEPPTENRLTHCGRGATLASFAFFFPTPSHFVGRTPPTQTIQPPPTTSSPS